MASNNKEDEEKEREKLFVTSSSSLRYSTHCNVARFWCQRRTPNQKQQLLTMRHRVDTGAAVCCLFIVTFIIFSNILQAIGSENDTKHSAQNNFRGQVGLLVAGEGGEDEQLSSANKSQQEFGWFVSSPSAPINEKKGGLSPMQDERITVKHKFTFIVNGRELALEPPSSVDQPAPKKLFTVKRRQSEHRQLSRLGDFDGNASTDYDTDGFDVKPDGANDADRMETSGSQVTENKVTKAEDHQSKATIVDFALQPPPSTSSSLMAPTKSATLANDKDEAAATTGFIKQSPSEEVRNRQTKSLSAQMTTGDSNIIADRFKSGQQAAKQASISENSDRHYSTTSKSIKTLKNSKFSALLTSAGDAVNESANQPGGDKLTGRALGVKFNTSDKAKRPETSAVKSETKGQVDNDDSNTKKRHYPRAPVYAKPRYTPAGVASSALLTERRGDDKSSGKLVGESAGLQLETANKNNNGTRQSAQMLIGPIEQVAASDNGLIPAVQSSRTGRGFDTGESSIISASNSIFEYPTNSNTSTNPSPVQGSNRAEPTIRRAQITQRDLTHRLRPFIPTSAQNLFAKHQPIARPAQQQQQSVPLIVPTTQEPKPNNPTLRQSTEPMQNSIALRTGPILPQPLAFSRNGPASSLHFRPELVPAAVALLAQAQQENQRRRNQQLQMLLANQQQQKASAVAPAASPSTTHYDFAKPTFASMNKNLSGFDQMVATSNHLGVSHLGLHAGGESNGYNSLAHSLHDYRADPHSSTSADGLVTTGGTGGDGNAVQASGTTMSNMLSDSSPRNQNVDNPDLSGSDPSYGIDGGASNSDASSGSGSGSGSGGGSSQHDHHATNSRSSMSDVYFRPEHKSSSSSGAGSRDSSSSSANYAASTRSVDPFEDMTNGISTSEYERDLADLDEEFNRAVRPPPVRSLQPAHQLMSDSYMSYAPPERYEPTRNRYSYAPRRPTPTSYEYSSGEYLGASMSGLNPRPSIYHRTQYPWAAYGAASDSSDLWTDSGSDYSPLASYVAPNTHYAIRWRPRYARTYPTAAATAASPAYLATSESHLQPAAYSLVPAGAYAPSLTASETVSFALSPLAAAAAAAASALAAADKTRHQNGQHAGWLTLPRSMATSTIATAAQPSPAASTVHTSTHPAGALQPAYLAHRPYALSSVPIYAIAPRPTHQALAAAASSGTAPSIFPYFHTGATPAIIAYRPAASYLAPNSLLTAASFAYPMRLPLSAVHHPRPMPFGASPSRAIGARPFFSDLAFAESTNKSKTTNSSDSNPTKGSLVRAGSLTAMARNLTKKMFGSASQIRPQHVAPPNHIFDVFSASHNSSLPSAHMASPSLLH